MLSGLAPGMTRETPRRQFLKYFITGTVTSAIAGRVVRSPVLWAAEPTLPQEPGIVRFDPNSYPALDEPLGSIRLTLNPVYTGGEPYPVGFFYPFMINRLPDDPEQTPSKQFIALDCNCPHAGCVVDAFNVTAAECRCHYSQYNIMGEVVGGPAPQGLTVLKHTYDGANVMTVEVPNLGYHAIPELAAGSRLKLSFFAFPAVNYRILSRTGFGPGTDWTPVSFSETPDGPLEQVEYYGAYSAVSLYVAASGAQSYFAITADLLQV
jgi:Rieske Fe-S protein